MRFRALRPMPINTACGARVVEQACGRDGSEGEQTGPAGVSASLGGSLGVNDAARNRPPVAGHPPSPALGPSASARAESLKTDIAAAARPACGTGCSEPPTLAGCEVSRRAEIRKSTSPCPAPPVASQPEAQPRALALPARSSSPENVDPTLCEPLRGQAQRMTSTIHGG